MVSYDAFDAGARQVVSAMRNAELRVRGYEPNPRGGYMRTGLGNMPPDPSGNDPIAGGSVYSVLAGPGQSGPFVGLDIHTNALFDVRGIYSDADLLLNFINEWKYLPEPKSFDSCTRAMAAGIHAISTGVEIKGIDYPAEDKMALIATVGRELHDMHGVTVDTFLGTYIDPLDGKVRTLLDAMGSLLVAYLGECQLWVGARRSWENICNEAIAKYDACTATGGPPTPFGPALKVAGVVLAVAGAFASGGASLVIGLAGTGIGVISGVLPASTGPSYRVGLPKDVTYATSLAFSALSQQISTEENDVLKRITAVSSPMTQRPGDYRLPSPSALLNETAKRGFFGPRIEIGLEAVKTVGRSEMRTLGGQFGLAANGFTHPPMAMDWHRDSAIGMAPNGPALDFINAVNALPPVLRHYATDLVHAGQVIAAAADNFHDTDGQWAAAMRTVERQLAG